MFTNYCSVAAHNIKMGWFRYGYDGHAHDKKWEFLNKAFMYSDWFYVKTYINNVHLLIF